MERLVGVDEHLGTSVERLVRHRNLSTAGRDHLTQLELEWRRRRARCLHHSEYRPEQSQHGWSYLMLQRWGTQGSAVARSASSLSALVSPGSRRRATLRRPDRTLP